MPTGEHPNSKKNLQRGKNNTSFTAETAAEAAKKSAAIRRELKSFREIDSETTTSDERQKMLERLKLLALKGNIRALELYLKIIGEYEIKVKAEVDQTTIEEIERLFDE